MGLMLAGSAYAQQGMSTVGDEPAPGSSPASRSSAPKDIRPPAPSEPEKQNIVVPYLLLFAIAGAAVGLAVFPSGRTHQD